VSELFREVDEEVRQEQLHKLWKKYGGYIVALVLAVVLGVGANIGWREYRRTTMEAEGTSFAAAVDLATKGETEQAKAAFATLADESSDGYAALARLREAGVLRAAGDIDGAAAALDVLANDDSAPDELRDLARLQAAMALVDRASADDLERRLEPLLGPESAWRASAREVLGLAALRRGDRSVAKEIFSALAIDEAAPAALRGRAAEMLAVLGGDGGGGG